MKQIFQTIWVCALLFTVAISGCRAQAVTEIVFSGGAEVHDHQPKIIIPLLTEAFKRVGITFSAFYAPSARSLILSNSGQTDGELHRVCNFHEVSNGAYPNLIKIDSELLSVWLVAFSHRRDIAIEKWEDLQNYRVMYYRGRQNVKSKLEQYVPTKQIFEVTNDKLAFAVLAHKRVDIVISESHEGRRILKSSTNFSNIHEVGTLEKTKIYSYINKKHQNLAPLIAEKLEEMKKDGTYSTLVNQFSQ